MVKIRDILLKHAYCHYMGEKKGNMIDKLDYVEIRLFEVQLRWVALYMFYIFKYMYNKSPYYVPLVAFLFHFTLFLVQGIKIIHTFIVGIVHLMVNCKRNH